MNTNSRIWIRVRRDAVSPTLEDMQALAESEDKFIDRLAERVDEFVDSNSMAVLVSMALITLYCWTWGMP